MEATVTVAPPPKPRAKTARRLVKQAFACGHRRIVQVGADTSGSCHLCTAALLIPGVTSCRAWDDFPLWLVTTHTCGRCKQALPNCEHHEAGEDGLAFVRGYQRMLDGCPDEETGKLLHKPMPCDACVTEADYERTRAQNRRLMPWLYAEGKR